MTTCQHPADKLSTETLLRTCPDCGAECSGAEIGDDQLCYDERCPLHAMEGAPPVPSDTSVWMDHIQGRK
jgi:hypothetical protein